MKRSIEETRDRFDDMSGEYDDTRTKIHHRAVHLVVDRAKQLVSPDTVAVDIGAGTGMVTLPMAPYVDEIYALDISPEMLRELDRKAEERELRNIRTAAGRFREPEMERELPPVDLVISNFAMHHLNDQEKSDAVRTMRSLLTREGSGGGHVMLGDVILFEDLEHPEEHFDPEVDDPATLESLTEIFREHGFELDQKEQISSAAGVLHFVYKAEPDSERS